LIKDLILVRLLF